MKNEDPIYRELQLHLDELPLGLPATRRGKEISVLKLFFTPEEANIAIKLSWNYQPLSVIHERLKDMEISIEELEKTLDKMVSKGGVNVKKEGEKSYANAYLSIGMLEHRVNNLTGELLTVLGGYFLTDFADEFLRTHIPQLRTIPIEKSITPEHHVATYDEMEKIISESDGPFAVQNCVCRKMQGIFNNPCKVTSRTETCITIGDDARMYIDEGWGREISKQETFEILRKNQEDGLVPQPGNYLKPQYFCSCCGCCCGILALMVKKLPKPVDFFATNYHIIIDSEECTGCETCIDRCQMDALSIEDNISTVNLDRCIGCGVCVPTCPSEAIKLVKNEEETIPPQTKEALYEKILLKKNEIRAKSK